MEIAAFIIFILTIIFLLVFIIYAYKKMSEEEKELTGQ
jgi:Na+/proline symporter